jgi:hypothetical protein
MLARVFAKFRRDENSVTSRTAEPVSIAATPPASAQADNGPPSTVPAALAPLAKPNSVPVHLSFSSEVAEYGQVEVLQNAQVRRCVLRRSALNHPLRTGQDL